MRYKENEEVVVKTFSELKKEKNIFITTYPFEDKFSAAKIGENYHLTGKMSELCGKKIKISMTLWDHYMDTDRNMWQDWMLIDLQKAKIKRLLES
jgi:hypothetical protein